MAVLRIGVNALYLLPGSVGGTEIYLRSLLTALAAIDRQNRYVVFTNRETGRDLLPAGRNFEQRPLRVKASFRPARICWEQTVLPLAMWNANIDVLFNPGFTAPFASPCPQVTVFHDLQHKRHPEYFRWFELPFWKLLLWMSARCSDRIVAVSDSTRDDLERFYGLRRDRVRVIPHGVDERFFELCAKREPTPYFLCVSTLHPHKNLERLIRVFGRFHAEHPEFRLIVVGMEGFAADNIHAQIAVLGLRDSVEITGWIPREDLYELFRKASAFFYPSTFEGFGMPILEAMAASVPASCSDIEPMRSITGDAALRVPPEDDAALLWAMQRLTFDKILRERLIKLGPRRARLFTWSASAKQTLLALKEAARAAQRK